MENYYGEQSGKGFKAKLKVSEEELKNIWSLGIMTKTFLDFLFSNVMVQMMNMLFGV